MKKIAIVFAIMALGITSKAQQPFKAEFPNGSDGTIEISLSTDEIIIEGTNSNEITIQGLGQENPDFGKQVIKEDEPKEKPKRAEGLKPITSGGKDNTGYGVTFEKLDRFAKVSSNMIPKYKKIKITIPNNVKLIINDLIPNGSEKAKYNISSMMDEITITCLNADVNVSQIIGPLVLNATNGSAEVKYQSLKTDRPVSIVSVNGFVDLTLPANTKANITMNSVNGEAFTDFDIKTEEDAPTMSMPGMNMILVNGSINGGGTEININSINGDIYLRKGK